MLNRAINHLTLSKLAATILGVGFIGGTVPAQAAPQLLYNSVQENGNLTTCLNLAQTAMAETGLVQQSATPNSINGSDSQLTASIYCQILDDQSFQAMVIIAGEEGASLAGMNSVLSSLSSVLDVPDTDAAPDSESATMSDAEFSQFMTALEDSWPDYFEFLAQPISSNYFTAAQASQIVGQMRFNEEQVRAAVMLYPRVVDHHNWLIVEEAVASHFARQDLREQISSLYLQ